MSDNKNGMVSLINFLGDDKIKFQIVHNSIDGQVQLVDRDKATRFTMTTDRENLEPADLITGKQRKIGLLIWVDPADFEQWRSQS